MPEAVLALLRPFMVSGTSAADKAFVLMRERALAYNSAFLSSLPPEQWRARGDELLAMYPEPELPASLKDFERLPGVSVLVSFVHQHAAGSHDRSVKQGQPTCAAVVTGHGVGRLIISAGIRTDAEEEAHRGRLRKSGVRWNPAVALVDELANDQQIWLPCPACEEPAMAVTGELVKRETELAARSSARRVALRSGELLR